MYNAKIWSNVLKTADDFDSDVDFACVWRVDDDCCMFVHCEDTSVLLVECDWAVQNAKFLRLRIFPRSKEL